MQHINTKKAEIIIDTLALVVKEERLRQDKSQRILADSFGIPKSLLSRIENGKNEPKLISIFTICEILNIKPSQLLKLVEERLPTDFYLMEQ